MRALILWADPAAPNLGVAALAEGAEAMLRSTGAISTVDFATFGGSQAAFALGTRAAVKDAVRLDRAVSRLLGSYDVVLDTGAGDSFAEIYGLTRLANIVNAQRIAKGRGAFLVLGPQTIGPFTSRRSTILAKYALRRANLVMSRDSVSSGVARGLVSREVVQVNDLVFHLPVQRPEASYDVILNVSGLLWRGSRHVDSKIYRSAVVDLCRGLRERGRKVTLLPHVLTNASTDDDVAILNELDGVTSGVFIPTSLIDARRAIAGAKLVIGSRMHCCLNALSQGVPAIPWAYSRKFAPLMDDIGWDREVDLTAQSDPATYTLEMLDGLDESSLVARAQLAMVRGRKAAREATGLLQAELLP